VGTIHSSDEALPWNCTISQGRSQLLFGYYNWIWMRLLCSIKLRILRF